MPAIHTLFAENSSSLAFQFGVNPRITIPQSSLTNGDRYLLMWQGQYGFGASCLAGYRLFIDSVEQLRQRCSKAVDTGDFHMMSGITVFTAGNTGDIELSAVGGNGIQGRASSERILLINLDDALVEDQDWFHNVNDVFDGPLLAGGDGYGNELEKAAVTFTPDGTSNYLAIGYRNTQFAGGKVDAFRLYNVTDAAMMSQATGGGGNIGNEQDCRMRMAVMVAPAAISTTVELQYKTNFSRQKNGSQVFILRLNAFSAHGFATQDINAQTTGARESLTSSFNITPDTNQEVILIGEFMAEMDIGIWSDPPRGTRSEIEYDSSVVAAGFETTRFTKEGGQFTQAESWAGEHLFTKITGQTEAPTSVEAFGTGSEVSADLLWQRQLLLAITTVVVIGDPPAIQNQNPAPSETLVDRKKIIEFELFTVDIVSEPDLQVSIQVAGAGYVNAIVNGVLQFPYDGPGSSIQSAGSITSVSIELNGAWPIGSVVDVRVDGENTVGAPMIQENYSFTANSDLFEEPTIIQVAKDTA